MTLRDDHGALPGHAEVLLRRLDTFDGLSAPETATLYFQHMQYAERCRVLGNHLRGILDLSARYWYAAALAGTRTALEHHLIDRLLFLADRWVAEIPVKAENVQAEEARLAALKAGQRPDFVSWRYRKVQGYQYNPFRVKKKVASRVAMGFRDPKVIRHNAPVSPYYF